jgi:hypothetical protein
MSSSCQGGSQSDVVQAQSDRRGNCSHTCFTSRESSFGVAHAHSNTCSSSTALFDVTQRCRRRKLWVFSGQGPGTGAVVSFSEYEAFALLNALRIMEHGSADRTTIAVGRTDVVSDTNFCGLRQLERCALRIGSRVRWRGVVKIRKRAANSGNSLAFAVS